MGYTDTGTRGKTFWGYPIGGERIAKLNELVRIEEELPNPKMNVF